MSVNKQEYHRASNAVVFGGVIIYVAGMLLLIAFSSPYWIASYDETFSSFKNMGLWEYCFEQFRYPYYQLSKEFDGCHHVYSQEFFVIREWLLPGWLLMTQTLVTIALLLSFFAQAVIAMILIRWPLKFVLNYEWLLSGYSFLCSAFAGFLLFLAVCIFVGNCWNRDWLLYPKFNHLSWSFAFALVSFVFHLFGSFFLYLDSRAGQRIHKESRNLVMQMQPNPQSHHGSQRSGYV